MGGKPSNFCVTDVIGFAEYDLDGKTIYLLGDNHSVNAEPAGYPDKSVDAIELVESLKTNGKKTFIYIETATEAKVNTDAFIQLDWGMSKYINKNRNSFIRNDNDSIQHIGVDTRQDNPIMGKYFGNTSIKRLQKHILSDADYTTRRNRSFPDVVRTAKLLTTGGNSLKQNIRMYLKMMTSGDCMSLITQESTYASAVNKSNNWGREFLTSVYNDVNEYFNPKSDSFITFDEWDLKGLMKNTPSINMDMILDKMTSNIMEKFSVNLIKSSQYITELDDNFLAGVSQYPRTNASKYYNKDRDIYDIAIQASETIMFYINSAIVDMFTLTTLINNVEKNPNSQHIIWLGNSHIINLTSYLDLMSVEKKFYKQSEYIDVEFYNKETKQLEYKKESKRFVCGALPDDHELLSLTKDSTWTKVGGLALLSCVNFYMVIIILLLVILIYIITKEYSNVVD
jgi:hypothetical protein